MVLCNNNDDDDDDDLTKESLRIEHTHTLIHEKESHEKDMRKSF